MIKRSIEKAARRRLALPLVLAMALVALAVNEGSFRHAWRALTRGIALTDTRSEAAKALLALTKMEGAARAVMDRDNAADWQRFQLAAREFDTAREDTLQLIAQVDLQRMVAVDKLRQLSSQHGLHYRSWLDQIAQPHAGLSRDISGESRASIAELQAELAGVLVHAEGVQVGIRSSIHDALMLDRVAVHTLVLLSVLAFVLFSRELRRSDAARVLEHQRLASQIQQRTVHLSDLTSHLVTVREDERGRLARELHDEMGGLLTAIKLELARLQRLPALPAAALDRLLSIDARLNEGIAVKRRIIENLRPSSLDQLGLKGALDLLCADSASVMAVPVEAEIEELSLGSDMDLTIYRVVQESLTNVAKYAAAREVRVTLSRAEGIATLTVCDDGLGFDPARVGAGHHGLLGMQVRLEGHQGTLQVHSQPGAGTRIVASLPCEAPVAVPRTPPGAQPIEPREACSVGRLSPTRQSPLH